MRFNLEKLFFILLFILISDLNGSLSIVFKTRGILSELILFLTIILFIRSIKIITPLTKRSIYFLSFFIFFITYGTLIYYLHGSGWGQPFDRVRSLTPSLILVFICSKWFLYFIKRGEFDKILKTITISLFINSIAIIYYFITSDVFIEQEADRNSGLIASVNQAGATAVLTQVFMAYYIFSHKLKFSYRFLFIVFYFISILAALLTLSKAAMLGSLIIFILLIRNIFSKNIYHLKIRRQLKIILIPLLFLSSMWISNYFILNLDTEQLKRFEIFGEFLNGRIDSETTTQRSEIALLVLDKVKGEGYMGTGLDSYHRIEGFGLGTHNQYLIFLGEIGIFGLILFLLYLIGLGLELYKIKDFNIRFLGLGIFCVLLITSSVAHTILFTKTYVIMFSLLGVLSFYQDTLLNKKSNE